MKIVGNLLTKAALIAVLAFIIPAIEISQANAAPQSTDSAPSCSARTGMIGIVRGQTARLNAVNANDTRLCRSVSLDVPPGPCNVQLEFIWLDRDGQVLTRSTETLMPGHSAYLDVDGNSLERQGNRAEIRGVVNVLSSLETVQDNGLIATAEVFNAEGKAAVLLPVELRTPSNDFSISASPSMLSIGSANSAVSTISTAITAGAAQPIAMGVSGLPQGASASFNPSSIIAGGSTTLTISTTNTPPGSYLVTVTGFGSTAVHATVLTLTVN